MTVPPSLSSTSDGATPQQNKVQYTQWCKLDHARHRHRGQTAGERLKQLNKHRPTHATRAPPATRRQRNGRVPGVPPCAGRRAPHQAAPSTAAAGAAVWCILPLLAAATAAAPAAHLTSTCSAAACQPAVLAAAQSSCVTAGAHAGKRRMEAQQLAWHAPQQLAWHAAQQLAWAATLHRLPSVQHSHRCGTRQHRGCPCRRNTTQAARARR